MNTLSNVETRGGETNPPCIEQQLDVIPEATSSKTGVSVRYVPTPQKNWYVFRASYGREDKALDILVEDGTYAYVAKRYNYKFKNGKKEQILETLIPNLLFVYTTAQKAEEYIKHTPTLSFLTYYYNHFEKVGEKNPPLIVPDHEMENFILATRSRNEHLMFVQEAQCHFKGGEDVEVIEGMFKGVRGRVARVSGQQRVVVSIKMVGLVSTAYIPTAFLKKHN